MRHIPKNKQQFYSITGKRNAIEFLLSQKGPNQTWKSEIAGQSVMLPVNGWSNVEPQLPRLWSDEYLPTGAVLIPSMLSQEAHMVLGLCALQKMPSIPCITAMPVFNLGFQVFELPALVFGG